MPRTATSWVGKMLEASGALVYVNEPLNPQHPPGRSPGVLRADVGHAFQYISEENERIWLPAFRDTVRLRFHPLAELRRNHRPYDLLRTAKYTAGFGLGRLRGRRALLDDPYAVFAAPWLHRRVGCRVVVTVRDPVATVSSWRRLGWTPRLAELLAQPALVRDRLERFVPELEAALAANGDGIGPASLLWRVIYGTVAAYRTEIDGLEVVRHEDLSADPVPAFAALYGRLGLRFGPDAERAILAATSAGSGGGAMRWSLSGGGVSKTAARRLDSRANLQVWRERLTPEEVARIRDLTADVAGGLRLHLGERQLVGPALELGAAVPGPALDHELAARLVDPDQAVALALAGPVAQLGVAAPAGGPEGGLGEPGVGHRQDPHAVAVGVGEVAGVGAVAGVGQPAGRLEPALPGAAGGRGDELDRAVVEAVQAVADQAAQVLVARQQQRPGPLDQLQGGTVAPRRSGPRC